MLWDVDGGLTMIDKYLYSTEDHIKSGALLACGIVNCGIRNEVDPAHALLSEYIHSHVTSIRIGAILGLGIAYAGSRSAVVLKSLKSVFFRDDRRLPNMEIKGITGLAMGLISIGVGNGDVAKLLLLVILNSTKQDLKSTYIRFLFLGLGLLYLGCQEGSNKLKRTLRALDDPYRSMLITTIDICAYAGSGNVLKIQEMLHLCTNHYLTISTSENKRNNNIPDDKGINYNLPPTGQKIIKVLSLLEKDKFTEKPLDLRIKNNQNKITTTGDLQVAQSIAVLGIAVIAMGEEVGAEMAFRSLGNLLRYCEPCIRRAVPLAMGLIAVSNPKLNILDTLSKFSHDSDADVTNNAIFAMGLVGAGTNNARLAVMLRQLAQYHSKSVNNLFMVRIAQSLIHLGKGTLTLSPYHSDRQLMNPIAVAGLLSTLFAFLDVRTLILGRAHYLLYTLVPAMQPRMLVTFDEELNQIQVPVRVGIALDVVGQAGTPRNITGFQTHTTPVLLAMGERAELATDEYITLTPILESFVILKKNPEYVK